MSDVQLTALTETEASELSACEHLIEKNLASFVGCGNALLKIRDARLYRADFPDFQSYCRERWQIGRSHAYRLIEAAEIAQAVPEVESERQARELARFEKEIQVEVFKIAQATAPVIDGAPKITAGHLKAVGDVLAAVVEGGGMDDGTGEMKPLGVLLKANVTEAVFERMKRQEEVIKEKREKKTREATTPKEVPALPVGQVLMGLVRDLVHGIEKMNIDRGVKLHPALCQPYHFGKAVIGEPTGEMSLLVDDVAMVGNCGGCPDEGVEVKDVALTVNANGLRSVRLKLCEHCVLRYQRIVEVAPEGEVVAR